MGGCVRSGIGGIVMENCMELLIEHFRGGGSKAGFGPKVILVLSYNIDKSWETPSDKTSVSSASKSVFLTSSIVIPGQCNFSCSREERMKASPWSLKTEIFF